MYKCQYCGKTSRSETKILEHMIKCKTKNNGYDSDVSFYSRSSVASNKYTKPLLDITPLGFRTNQTLVDERESKYIDQINTLNNMVHDQELFYKKKLNEMNQKIQNDTIDYDNQIMALRDQIHKMNGKVSVDNHINEQYAKDIINRDVDIAKLKQTITGLEETIRTNERIAKIHLDKQLVSQTSVHNNAITALTFKYDGKIKTLEDEIVAVTNDFNSKKDNIRKILAQKYEQMLSDQHKEMTDKIQKLEADNLFLVREKDISVKEISNKHNAIYTELGFVQLRYDQLSNTYDTYRTNKEAEYNQLKQEKLDSDSKHKYELNEVSTKLKTLYTTYEEILVKNTEIREQLNVLVKSSPI